MYWRVLSAAVCVLALAACQQQPPTAHTSISALDAAESTGAVTAATAEHGQDVPFKGMIVGHSQFLLSNPKGCVPGYTTVTDGTGNASHLGRISSHWEHCVQPGGGWIGEMVFTAANGDEVHATYDGHGTGPLPPVGEPMSVVGTMTITGGTGRFLHASGSAEYAGQLTFQGFADFDWPGEWRWEGRMRY